VEGDVIVAKKKTGDGTLDAALYLRITTEDLERLDKLTERLPIASRNAIAREAMRLGLEALEKDPTRLVLPVKSRKRW
jgi:hypothetical protein